MPLLREHHQQRRVRFGCRLVATYRTGHWVPTILRNLQVFYHPVGHCTAGLRRLILQPDYKRLCRALLLLHGIRDNQLGDICSRNRQANHCAVRSDILCAVLLLCVYQETDKQADLRTVAKHNQPLTVLSVAAEPARKNKQTVNLRLG